MRADYRSLLLASVSDLVEESIEEHSLEFQELYAIRYEGTYFSLFIRKG